MDEYSLSLVEEMNCYYEARAPWHDQYMDIHSREQTSQRFKNVIATIEPYLKRKRVLEIACGTGNWTQLIAPIAASVVAIDSSPTSLAMARAKLVTCKNVQLIQDDAYQLIHLSGHIDAVFMADFWSHIPKKLIHPFLNNLRGRLAPKAAGIVLDMSRKTHFEKEDSRIDADGNRISLRRLPDGREFQVVKNFPSETDLRDAIMPLGEALHYIAFRELQRWLVCFNFAT